MITVSNVVNASQEELLCITYELLLEQIDLAQKCEEIEERKLHTEKAIHILQMLAGDLNFEYDIAKELFRIYVYVQGLLINGKYTEKLEEAYRLIHKIYLGYKQITEEMLASGRESVMQNAEKVYAGLTYGKGTINETVIENENRGFKA